MCRGELSDFSFVRAPGLGEGCIKAEGFETNLTFHQSHRLRVMLSGSASVERKRLLHHYHECLIAYSEMATILDKHATCRDFVKTYKRAEDIRLRFERARAELHRHMDQHGCEMPEASTV